MVTHWNFLSSDTIPRPLDVVWCAWPDHQILEPNIKQRPCLVRSLMFNRENETYAVEVSYGTSVFTKAYPYNLYVTQIDDMMEAGLRIATRFDLTLIKKLPWASDFFTIRERDGVGPIIGHLSDNSREQLEIVKPRN